MSPVVPLVFAVWLAPGVGDPEVVDPPPIIIGQWQVLRFVDEAPTTSCGFSKRALIKVRALESDSEVNARAVEPGEIVLLTVPCETDAAGAVVPGAPSLDEVPLEAPAPPLPSLPPSPPPAAQNEKPAAQVSSSAVEALAATAVGIGAILAGAAYCAFWPAIAAALSPICNPICNPICDAICPCQTGLMIPIDVPGYVAPEGQPGAATDGTAAQRY